MTPKYLKDNLPKLRLLLYGNDSPYTYHLISCNTKRYMDSFFPDATRNWNLIDNELHKCNSSESFKV